jgi:hypothetical protein
LLGRTVDADKRRGAGGEALLANGAAAYIAHFVHAGIDFPQRLVHRRKMLARLRDQCRNVLPFEGERRALRVVLVVAPGGAVGGARDDRVEVSLQVSETLPYQFAIGIQPRLSRLCVIHGHRLLF